MNAIKNRVGTLPSLLFIRQWTFDPFQMDQLKLSLTQHNNVNKTHSRNSNCVLTYRRDFYNRVTKLISNSRNNPVIMFKKNKF